ncbi:hypothetical protein UAW_01264 [Enterococcus haemoperoxidus ATCC BAA-382]|uniref:Uncharacterized protein n=1 Tax=Enterococcus haemoperoxidus ATCC BAA-382 TaxID=1158608 RepID=R2QTS8_9ENTE|nr:hypothetical protein [Enterococcus haemoperoxidus]EOH98668.1 hypothetical protein UAW_01264 [Enterococcus haemoperoxidus ATCC BAA-382]EOT62149.1 hypothetical protein I583_01149 [Enterococcus haemoperoxidus ATCC BAA-382]OJG55770.1 hypothetical protein RV06_GL001352 [Enterococcus haemoperoxidus]
MNIRCTRNTGFYGMGSPIEIRKNDKKWFYLSHNEIKQVEIDETECTIQAKFFFLKSAPFAVSDQGRIVDLEITMNPTLILIYVILFIGMFLIPLLHLNIIGILLLFVLYFIFVFSMLNKAYVIKEKM